MSESVRPRAASRVQDVVVLGAGIIGAAVARELAVLGLRVAIVESSEPGTGSSGRCDGNLLLQTKHDDVGVDLTLRSIDGYRRWVGELGSDLHFEQEGSLVFFTDEQQVDGGLRRVEWLRGLGVRAEYLDQAEVRRREPALDGPLVGGIDCLDDASVYPPAVVFALIADAVARGAELVSRTRAVSVLSSGGKVEGVETDRGTITAPWVVNAMGVWSPELRVDAGIELPVRPRQGVLLVSEEAPGLLRRSVTEAGYITLRAGGSRDAKEAPVFVAEPTYRGNILIGSSRRFVGHTTAVDSDLVRSIAERAVGFVSGLGGLRIIRSFAGLRPWTPDNHPIVGTVDDLDGYVLATGHEGEGIGMAPVTAEMVVHLVTGRSPDATLDGAFATFDPRRLAAASRLAPAEAGTA